MTHTPEGAQRPKASERELLRGGGSCLPINSCAQRPKASERELQGCRAVREPAWPCSTPEGIGAGITHRSEYRRTTRTARVLNARRHRSGNYLATLRSRSRHVAAVLNARRHRSGNYRRGGQVPADHGPGAQRPKASERELLRHASSTLSGQHVLNARRHRSGNYQRNASAASAVLKCSTPEGIGAGITRTTLRAARPRASAQRPKASERELHDAEQAARAEVGDVLNARRHRSGNYTSRSAATRRRCSCSTPEGIGAGITSLDISNAQEMCEASAQRRKASERELLSARLTCGRGVPGAQRPKASERELLPTPGVLPSIAKCSTPEGIGAGITDAGSFIRRSRHCAQRPKASERELPGDASIAIKARCCSAQRPKASERELRTVIARCATAAECSTPEGIGAGITAAAALRIRVAAFAEVLNARRHRSGNYSSVTIKLGDDL